VVVVTLTGTLRHHEGAQDARAGEPADGDCFRVPEVALAPPPRTGRYSPGGALIVEPGPTS
jgi:hypothetical protein